MSNNYIVFTQMERVHLMIVSGGTWDSLLDGNETYNGGRSFGITVRRNINYLDLVNELYSVCRKSPDEFNIKMRVVYKHCVPSSVWRSGPSDVKDDTDVAFFVDVNSQVSTFEGFTPLFITFERRDSGVGITGSPNVQATQLFVCQLQSNVGNPFASSSGSNQVNDTIPALVVNAQHSPIRYNEDPTHDDFEQVNEQEINPNDTFVAPSFNTDFQSLPNERTSSFTCENAGPST